MLQQQKTHISLLRVLAALAVITMHVGSGGSHPSDAAVRSLVSALNTWCVPVFIMITGALFLGTGKPLDLKTHGRRVLRLLLILLFWAFFYNAVCLFLIDRGTLFQTVRKACSMTLLADTTYCYHFWYLYVVIGLYLLLPVLNAFLTHTSEKEQLALSLVFFAFTFIVPMLQTLMGLDDPLWKGSFQAFGGYSGYLLLGYWSEKHLMNKSTLLALLIVLAGQVVLFAALAFQGSPLLEKLTGYRSFYAAEAAFTLYQLCRHAAPRLGEQGVRAVRFLAKYSLAVYILHVMVLQMLRKLAGLDSAFAPLYVSIPVLTALAFVLSLLLGMLLKKLPYLKQLL